MTHPSPSALTAALTADNAFSPLQRYDTLVQQHTLTLDSQQQAVMHRLDRLYHSLLLWHAYQQLPRMRQWLTPEPPRPRGVFVWGHVGRGKSMLMDMFFHSLPLPKKRLHFHAFMRHVHHELHQMRTRHHPDPLLPVADALAKQARLMYLDEYEVQDVADAMLLSRLFARLLEQGCICVFTSNRPPEEHYQGGLQRDRYLAFVQELQQQVEVLSLDSPTDYRMLKIQAMQQTYWHPLTDANADALLQAYRDLTDGFEDETTLEVLGRTLHFPHAAGNVLLTDFATLCAKELGSADYLAIANRFDTLCLQHIPTLGSHNRNEARRFVTLIDILYQQKVKLLCTAAAPAEALYPEGDGAFEFRRTVSRLNEMRSGAYLEQHHQPHE